VKHWKTNAAVSLLAGLAICACATSGENGEGNGANGTATMPDPDKSHADAGPDVMGTPPPPPPAHDSGSGSGQQGQPDSGGTPPVDSGQPGTCNAVLFFTQLGLPDCDMCLTGSCCQTAQACFQDSDCTALYNCMLNCNNDNTCGQNCAHMHMQASVLKANAVTVCMTGPCKGYCQ
jgi:hypothetical protein